MSDKITQSQVDLMFEELKGVWDKRVKESGQTESMFIALDTSGFVSQFFAYYQMSKEAIEEQGLVLPELVKGLIVNLTDEGVEDE